MMESASRAKRRLIVPEAESCDLSMITPEDYLDQEFGWFRVYGKMGAGADAEVFKVAHTVTRRTYVLKLDVNDDEIWERDAPMLPPHNLTIRTPYIGGTVSVLAGNYSFSAPELYGVRDGRYLIPLTRVHRLKGAIEFEKLLDIAAEDVIGGQFWENLVSMLEAETLVLETKGGPSMQQWMQRWNLLICSSKLGQRLLERLPGSLSDTARRKIHGCVRSKPYVGPNIEESAVFRAISGVVMGRFSAAQIAAAFSCPFFRMNITLLDLDYTVFLGTLCQDAPWLLPHEGIRWLGLPGAETLMSIIQALSRQPYILSDDRDKFERCEPPTDDVVTRYPLFLQDVVATIPYISLRRE
jgi:hypothetical protein